MTPSTSPFIQRLAMHITTRDAQAADLAAISRLFDLYRQFYGQAPDATLAKAFLTDRFERRESVILVAQDTDSAIIGFCQLYPSHCSVEARPIYCLYDLFVMPDARQRGAGRMLLRAAQARASADGMARMDLTTAKTNLRAQALYESEGWEREQLFFAYTLRILGHIA